ARPALHPRQRDARDGGAELLGDALHQLEQIVGAIVELAGDARAAARLVLALIGALVLARQRTAAQHTPRADAEDRLARHRHQLARAGALQERVFDLQRDQRRPRAQLRHGLRLRALPRRRVAEAEVADLALLDQGVEGAHRLLDRSRLIPD